MNFLSLFSGIGGFDLALERYGCRCAGQVENDPFCTRVLERHWPHVPRWGDVRSVLSSCEQGKTSRTQEQTYSDGDCQAVSRDVGDGRACTIGSVDLLCGGWPCQDFSVAGKRAGLTGARSGLFWEAVRIAHELKPTWGLWENVPGLFSAHAGRDFWAVLNGLRECWPVVGYRVLDSQHFGVPQRRRRIFFVCGPTEASISQILFEPEGGGGDSTQGGETRPDVAYCLAARAGSPSGIGPGWNYVVNSDCGGSTWRTDAPTLASSDDNGTNHLVTNTFNGYSGCPDDNDAQGKHLIAAQTGVRRLTPIEAERLQGFPDGFTCICGANENLDACVCPDSPRYRALGNAVTVNVVAWIAARLRQEAGRASSLRKLEN